MEINDALFTYLSGYAGLTVLVGDRIYPDILPQKNTGSAIAYQLISRVRDHLFRQDSNMARSRYQFSAYASSRSISKAVAKQLRLALQNYTGFMNGVNISAVEIDGEVDDYEPDTFLYSTKTDFLIWHEEA